MEKLKIREELFGPLLPFVNNEMVTDINWNGECLWVNDLQKGKYATKVQLSEIFIKQFAQKLSNLVNVSMNKYQPYLEAETDNLRVSIIDESVTNTGYSISIRKTPPVRRITEESIIEEGYCSEKLNDIMAKCVRAGCNIVVCGTPGVGKTEYLKYLTKFIPPYQKVITIEDNLEIRYRKINPGKDCVEIKIGDTFSYDDAIKKSLRQLPDWILLSEARSREVEELVKSMSNGCCCITTLHTDDVRRIPDRIRNMSSTININDVFSFVDVGVQICSRVRQGEKIQRYIYQVAFYDRDIISGKNEIVMLYQDGKIMSKDYPESIKRKFKLADIHI